MAQGEAKKSSGAAAPLLPAPMSGVKWFGVLFFILDPMLIR